MKSRFLTAAIAFPLAAALASCDSNETTEKNMSSSSGELVRETRKRVNVPVERMTEAGGAVKDAENRTSDKADRATQASNGRVADRNDPRVGSTSSSRGFVHGTRTMMDQPARRVTEAGEAVKDAESSISGEADRAIQATDGALADRFHPEFGMMPRSNEIEENGAKIDYFEGVCGSGKDSSTPADDGVVPQLQGELR